jgi:RNA polymerase sigma-70 factor (ECF subfamily)
MAIQRARVSRYAAADGTPMNKSDTGAAPTRDAFERVLGQLRPKLHRYCARMTGSVIDGEDVVQDAFMKAIEAFDATSSIANPEGWLFRIAHNAALDFLRRRARHAAIHANEDSEMIPDPVSAAEAHAIAAASLRTFMRLPVTQRSSVILMDVLGYSLKEVRDITGSTIPAIKTAVHRGRARLLELAHEPDNHRAPRLTERERSLLGKYIDRFNARDFDAIRDMLADEVRLELVTRKRAHGRSEVASYFHNYSQAQGWHLVAGFVDGRPAIVVHDPDDPSGAPTYFILLEWAGSRVVNIRDFAHARYVIDDANVVQVA